MQAHFANVNLAANSFFVPDPTSMRYLNYGAAVSEVKTVLHPLYSFFSHNRHVARDSYRGHLGNSSCNMSFRPSNSTPAYWKILMN